MRKLILLLITVSTPFLALSQNRVCGTDQYHSDLIKSNPAYETAYQAYLEQLTEIAQNPTDNSHGKKAVVTIPVVFHVIHEYGEENISKAQILDQMRILNEDFRRLNADRTSTREIFQSVAADVEIEFKLATKDPNGNCTDGITRTVSPLTNGGDEDAKKLIRWDYKRYLNIWVLKSIGRASNILGYARFPFQTSEEEDGIVVLANFVGSIGTGDSRYEGRTLTHEIGHWLGLRHTFQDAGPTPDCGTSNCQTSGDRVCDTPPVLEASFGCGSTANTCTIDSPDLPDQTENFMDYADGRCANMFSKGQKSIMDFYLSRSDFRGGNVSAATATSTGINISNPCAPKADFHVINRYTTVCEGGSLEYEDLSWNGDIVDRVWTFEGGSPSSSTFANPTVVYNKGGVYKVTLKVSNAQGESEITKTEFITVQDEVAELSSPFLETFESPFSEFTWDKEFDGSSGWRRLDGEGYENGFGKVCLIDNESAVGAQFNLISPNFDLSLHEGLTPVLSFRAAYSMRETGTAGERIVIYGSDDCGNTWRVLRSLLGITTLKSKDGNNPGWKPTSNSDWKLHVVDLDQYDFDKSTNLMLRFEATSNAGNSVFLDDINVDRNVLSTDDLRENTNWFSLIPNPSSGTFNVRLENIFEPINIEVIDVLGQKIQTLEVNESGSGQIMQPVTVRKPGVYLVRITGLLTDYTKRIVISE